jgi:hypothetical protein
MEWMAGTVLGGYLIRSSRFEQVLPEIGAMALTRPVELAEKIADSSLPRPVARMESRRQAVEQFSVGDVVPGTGIGGHF